ncbi:LCP family protein [Virgibacillus byunsanensis]|uniref:LCP family protein n=1 Tax=Virgibacillus byunsanensis TaxID=570945 RepID=A0ABW3LHK1_9BACI
MIKRNYSKKKLFLYTGFTLLFFLSIGVGYTLNLYNKTEDIVTDSHQEVGRDNEISQLREEGVDPVDPVEDNVSVLFIGIDNSEIRDYEDGSRSDALLLATFNKEKSSVKLLSIPRDSYVYVPEIGYFTKINHAHFYGGPKATIETVEEFFHVPVDYFVRVNFDAFIDVVDSLGGITYDVPYEMQEMNSDDTENAIHLYPGAQNLTGEEALALARTRKYDSDIERGERQQEIIKTIAKKATSASSIFKLEEVIDAVGANMNTNLTFNEMKSFLSYGLDTNVNIETVNLIGDGKFKEDDLWYFEVDEYSRSQVQTELREHLSLPNTINEASDFADGAEEDTPY